MRPMRNFVAAGAADPSDRRPSTSCCHQAYELGMCAVFSEYVDIKIEHDSTCVLIGPTPFCAYFKPLGLQINCILTLTEGSQKVFPGRNGSPSISVRYRLEHILSE